MLCGSATAIPQYDGAPPAGVMIDPNGNMLTVTAFDGAVLEWLSFNIASFETVHFDLPSDQARVLNNITGSGESFINGGLTSNGIIYIANPAGIIFGQSAMVNVGGIYAAAGTIDDFGSMVETFNLTGEVKNAGMIQGQQIHLLGNFVRNSGMLSSNGGIITMLAGDQVMLGEIGGNLMVKIDGRDILNASPNGFNPTQIVNGLVGVENTGVIDAGNGRVVLGAGDMYGLAIKHTGEITGGEITISSNNVVSMIDGDITGEILDFNAPIVIGSNDVTLSGSSLVNFASSIDSVQNQSNSLEIIGPDIRVNGNIGVQDRLFNLDFHNNGGAGLITLNSGSVLTNGYQHYGMDLETTNSTNFISFGPGMGAADLIFDGNINGNTHLLRFTSDGATIWNGQVTAGQIQTGAAGVLIINGGLVDTIGSQFYFNNVLLGADTLMRGQAIGFVGDLNSVAGDNFALEVQSLGAGPTIFLGDVGNVNALSMLTTNAGGTTFIFGDVTTTNGVFLNDNVSLMGDDNIIDAGMGELFVGGTFTKNTLGDVTLISGDSIILEQGAAINMGSLTFDGAADVAGDLFASDNMTFLDLADLAGDVEAGLDLTFEGPVTLDGNADQLILAGGVLTSLSTIQKINSGSLTLEADSLDLDDNVSVLGGSLTVNGAYAAAGDLLAAEDITLNGDGVLDGADQRIDALTGVLTANGALTKTTDGVLTLAGDAGVDLNGDVDAQVGDLVVEDDLNAAGDIDAAGSIDLNGAVVMDGAGDQAVTAGDTLTAAGTVAKTTAGDLQLTGDLIDLADDVNVAAGDLDVDGDVNLSGDVELAATNIAVNGAVDGPFTLSATAADDLTFNGDLGANIALLNLITDAGGVTTFGGSLVNVTDSILLNVGQVIDVPDAATIVGTGDLMLVAGDDIRFGQNQKLSVLGDLDLIAGDTAAFGDLSVLGVVTVDAATIELLTREPGVVQNADGSITVDFGLDLVAGGGFNFSVAPILIGGGGVFFGTPDGTGDLNGTLGDFAFRTVEGGVGNSAFFFNGRVLDLTATGPTNANISTTFAGLTPAPDADPTPPVRPDGVIRAILAALGVNADAPNLAAAREGTATGLEVSLDLPAVLNPGAADYRVSNGRLARTEAERVLESFLLLTTGRASRTASEGRIELVTDGSPAAALDNAWAAHSAAGGTVDGFTAALEAAGDEAALEAIRRTRTLLRDLRRLGLSDREYLQARAALLDIVRPDGAPAAFDDMMTR